MSSDTSYSDLDSHENSPIANLNTIKRHNLVVVISLFVTQIDIVIKKMKNKKKPFAHTVILELRSRLNSIKNIFFI
ncbi:Protein of unknown function [Cotesia congregata]|uniref:Uncharacterized protein n=1 Tax=Cotesia congregata TaxID=51543 RepID=A0A8J2HLE4_COTCN|nr:Protein of unknown function [Cotesia congregata]